MIVQPRKEVSRDRGSSGTDFNPRSVAPSRRKTAITPNWVISRVTLDCRVSIPLLVFLSRFARPQARGSFVRPRRSAPIETISREPARIQMDDELLLSVPFGPIDHGVSRRKRFPRAPGNAAARFVSSRFQLILLA